MRQKKQGEETTATYYGDKVFFGKKERESWLPSLTMCKLY